MLLAIDSGNTNVVFALLKDPQTDAGNSRGTAADIIVKWRIETHDPRTADEYFVWLSQLATLKGIDLREVSGVIIANVRPASSFALERLSKDHLGISPLVIGRDGCHPDIEVILDHPEQVGADRLVNAYAAKVLYGGAAILIDTGTATTFDILDDRGAYVGGVIAPGIHVSAQALAQAAAQLPLVSVEQPASPIGTDTRSAMQSGLFWGYIALLEGLIDRLKSTMITQRHSKSADISIIGTGGLMKILSQGTQKLDRVEPDLTLYGLALIYQQQRPKLN